jgi:hypothetical protein
MAVTVERVVLRAICDTEPDLSYLEQFDINDPDPELRKYARLDRLRLRAWHRDCWWCVGLVADAVLTVSDDTSGYTATVRHRGPGLWGIESDSDLAYIVEMWAERFGELADDLPPGALSPDTPVVVASEPEFPEPCS